MLARSAALADAAATLLANAVDLPGHPSVIRSPASELSPDSDLGDTPVTTDVGPLTDSEITTALAAQADLGEALELANAAASVVVHKLGTTGTASISEISGKLGFN